MRYASLLHDFGKVAVPEYIFGKAKKLPDGRIDEVRLRFLLAIEQCGDPRQRERLRALLATVEAANEPRIMAGEIGGVLDALAKTTYRDLDGERPVLTGTELEYLRIARGSLSRDERRAMEQHVTQSFYFLREIPWRKTPWANVPEYAYGHHEHLDGTGYPRGLTRRGDRAAGAAADDQRHLRRADRARPPLQAGDAGGARARHPRRASSPSAARSTPTCSTSSSPSASTSRCSQSRA